MFLDKDIEDLSEEDKKVRTVYDEVLPFFVRLFHSQLTTHTHQVKPHTHTRTNANQCYYHEQTKPTRSNNPQLMKDKSGQKRSQINELVNAVMGRSNGQIIVNPDVAIVQTKYAQYHRKTHFAGKKGIHAGVIDFSFG